MPQIPQYTAQSPGIAAPETGAEATARAARLVGSFYHQTGQEYASAISGASKEAQEYLDHQELSHGAVAEAGMLSDLTDKWNAVISDPHFDPNNPVAAKQFRDQVLEPQLEKFQGGFNTQRGQDWAQSRTERIRDHFFEKTAADVASMAGIAAINNVHKTGNTWSNLAARDPSATGYLLDNAPDSIEAMIPPTVKGEQRAKIKAQLTQSLQEQIAKAGLYGAIQKSSDPEKAAADMTSKYPQYINGVEADQAAKAAKAQVKANALTDRQLLATSRALSAQAMERDFTEALNNNLRTDPTNPGHYIVNPNLTQELLDVAHKHQDAPGVQEHFRAIASWQQHQIDAENKPPVLRDDPGTKKTLLDGIATGQTKDIDILRAETAEKITRQTAHYIEDIRQKSTQMPKNDATLNAALAASKEVLIGPTMQGIPKDPHSGEDYLKFLQLFQPEYLKKRNNGTLEPSDLDMKDPDSMISKALRAATPDPKTKMERQQQMFMTPGITMGPGNVPVYGGGGMVPGGGSIVGGGPTPNAPTALPPVESRVKGQIYNLPRGRFEWDGTKWLQR